ncbi:MAG: urease subunit gamma, partial [Muribaculaceae bacterium]|nr:urease subunit gamma [Muribaculaceae bacterium]
MHLTPKELDKLKLLTLGMIAERRLNKGLKLNYPESVAYITSAALEGAREGKTVEEVMHDAANVLTSLHPTSKTYAWLRHWNIILRINGRT